MPAITLGLAEVEKRLRALRRRLNSITVQHSIYLGVSAVSLLVAAVIVVGLRAPASTFRVVACGSALLVIVIAAACLGYARRRWLDVRRAALLVDARAQLTDRLSTLIDLQLRPRSSRLAPLLVAQTLALGAQWQARQIAPRQMPRSILLAVAALLVLAGTAFVERRTPPQVSSPTMASAEKRAESSPAAISGARRDGGSGTAAPPDTRSGLQPPTTLGPPGDVPGRARGSEIGEGQGNPSPPSERARPRPSLTDRLQQTIRHAFHGDAAEQPSQLASRSGTSARDDSNKSADHHPRLNRGDQPDDTAPKNPGGVGRQKEPKSGRRGPQPHAGPDAPQSFEGRPPAAGEGSNPHGLMDPKAAAAVASQGESKRFKLAITSFLRPVPQPAGGSPRAGAAEPSSGGGGALSQRQIADDAIRKAEIPAEYEDLVRRVYSRTQQ